MSFWDYRFIDLAGMNFFFRKVFWHVSIYEFQMKSIEFFLYPHHWFVSKITLMMCNVKVHSIKIASSIDEHMAMFGEPLPPEFYSENNIVWIYLDCCLLFSALNTILTYRISIAWINSVFVVSRGCFVLCQYYVCFEYTPTKCQFTINNWGLQRNNHTLFVHSFRFIFSILF